MLMAVIAALSRGTLENQLERYFKTGQREYEAVDKTLKVCLTTNSRSGGSVSPMQARYVTIGQDDQA